MLYRRLIQHLGAEFKGLQDYGHAGTLVYFNDPRTGSTLALRVEELTAANIRKHLLESRSKFSGLRARTA